MGHMSSFLKFIDIYGQKVEIQFKNQPIFKTVYGGIVTFVIALFFAVGCWFFGNILINRLNPTVITQQRSVVEAARVNITNENIVVMVGVSNLSSQIWRDPTIFSVRAVQQIMQVTYNNNTGYDERALISTNKTMKICDESDIGITQVEDYYNQLNLNNLFCFEQGQDLFMQGDFDAQHFAQVFIYIEKCANGTNVICKPIDVINQQLLLTKVQIYISNTIVDPNNFDSPFSSKGMNLYSQTSSGFPKEVDLFFTNQYIQDDIGYMYTQTTEKHNFVFTNFQETSFFGSPQVLVRVLLRLQKQVENLMQRRYQKFQDVVAQIGGLLKILTTFGSVITYPFTTLYLFKAIGDKLFNFMLPQNNNNNDGSDDNNSPSGVNSADSSKKKKKNNKKKESNMKGQTIDTARQIQSPESNQIEMDYRQNYLQKPSQSNIGSNNNSMVLNSNNSPRNKIRGIGVIDQFKINIQGKDNLALGDNNSFMKKEQSLIRRSQEYIKKIQNKITFRFRDYFRLLYSKNIDANNLQSKLVQKGINLVERQLDIVYMINKLQEIDKLKAVILNPDQLKLFEYIPKPIISEDETAQERGKSLSLPKSQLTQLQKENSPQIGKIATQNIVSNDVYSHFKEVKGDDDKIRDANVGLQNILSRKQLTVIDRRLIELIELETQSIAVNEQYAESIKTPDIQNDSIFSSHQFVFQQTGSTNLKEEDLQRHLHTKFIYDHPSSSATPQILKTQKSNPTGGDTQTQKQVQFQQNRELRFSIYKNDKNEIPENQMMPLDSSSQFEDEANLEKKKSSEAEQNGLQASKYNPELCFPINTINSIMSQHTPSLPQKNNQTSSKPSQYQ